MYIDLVTHVITNNAMNFILNVKVIANDGKNAGNEYIRPIKYYSTLDNLIQALPTQVALSDKDSRSLDDLNANIGQYIATLKELIHAK